MFVKFVDPIVDLIVDGVQDPRCIYVPGLILLRHLLYSSELDMAHEWEKPGIASP
jgi:hypothetical protein